jgi:O-antigen/teichoic acid export membrane protein
MPVYRLSSQRSPLARALSLLVFVAVIALALVLGIAALVVVLALAAVLSLRLWWFRRRGGDIRRPPVTGDYIEGEYTVEKEEPRRRE